MAYYSESNEISGELAMADEDSKPMDENKNPLAKTRAAATLTAAGLLGAATEEFSREAINTQDPKYGAPDPTWSINDPLHAGGDRLGRDGAIAVDAVRKAAVNTGRDIDKATNVIIHHPGHAADNVGDAFEVAGKHIAHASKVAAVNTGDALKRAAKVTWKHPGQAADDVGRAVKTAAVDTVDGVKNVAEAFGRDVATLSHDPAAMAASAAGATGAAILATLGARQLTSEETKMPEGYSAAAEAEQITKEAAGEATVDSQTTKVSATDKMGIAERLKRANKAAEQEAGVATGKSK